MVNFNAVLFFLFSLTATSALAKDEIVPLQYDLHIITTENDFKSPWENLTFDGTVDILLKLNIDKSDKKLEIVLNANAHSKFSETTLKSGNKTIEHQIRLDGDKVIILCNRNEIESDSLKLSISFNNPYGNDMTGFYRSSYKDSSGETRWLLTTHFEPIFARKAFPCFDVPHLKAFFNIKLTVPKDINTVLCNTPSKKVNEGKYNVYICEKQLIPMSTYLVAFTASNFKSTEAVKFVSDYPAGLKSERSLKTFGRDEIIDRGEGMLAQNAGKEALNCLKEYTGIGYALEKVDQVGIPDFSAGAMENWGHISFREKSLFFNDKTGSTATKQANVLTITHELVHQWFGNLVTLESWDYIWLNEAFANYLEYVIASQFTNPSTKEWNLMNQFVVNDIHARAFETDGLNSSKPLNNKITDEKLIYSSFNDIPYAKGAAVLRMWHNVLKDKFQESLKKYINDRKGLSANPSQLFTFFKEVGKMNEMFFKTWTDQEGYPVVEVKKTKKNEYKLSQSRFFWEKESSNATWYIPVSFITNTLANFSGEFNFMDKTEYSIKAEGDWIIVNYDQAGYYRVNYERENWLALSSALSKNISLFPEVNRAQIVNDIFSLARSLQKAYVDYSTALDLAKYLKKENSLIVLKTALNAFDFLQTKLYKTESKDNFKNYVLDLVSPHFKTLNSSNFMHTEKLKNMEISRWACSLQFKPCVEEAKKIYQDSTYGNLPDTQETILCTVIRNDQKQWQKIFENYKKEKESALKLVYLTALGCTTDAKKAEEFLTSTLEKDSAIRKQDLVFVVLSVINGNLQNVDVAFKFLENNFSKMAKAYAGINPIGKILVGIAKKLNTKTDFDRLKKLTDNIRKDENSKGSEESIQNALQIAQSNYLWINEKKSQLTKYFNSGSFVSYSVTLLSLCLAFVFNFNC